MPKGPFPARILMPALLGCILATTSCNSGGMPLQRPADLQVTLMDGGGMTPESETIYLSADSSWYENWYDQAHNHTALPVAPTEMDTLWDLLRTQGALSVTSRQEGEVFDRGGTTIQIQFGTTVHQITNAGSSFISARHVKQYDAIVEGVWKLARKHIKRMQVEVPLIIFHHQDSIPMDYFNLEVDGQPVYNWEATKNDPFSEVQATATCLPGTHQVNAWAKVGGKQLSDNRPMRMTGKDTPVSVHLYPDSIVVR